MKYARDHQQRVKNCRAATRAVRTTEESADYLGALAQNQALKRLRSSLTRPIHPLAALERSTAPENWCEAVSSLSKEELANDICTRFFAGDSITLAAEALPQGDDPFPTLGQMLQTLHERMVASEAMDSAEGRTLVDLLPEIKQFDNANVERRKASRQSVMTARAA